MNAQIPGPYVLVDHSIASWIDLRYAKQYPDEVAGLVLLMGWHPDQESRMNVAVQADKTAEPGTQTPELNAQQYSLAQWYKLEPYDQDGWDVDTSAEQVRRVTSLGDIPMLVLTTDFSYIPGLEITQMMIDTWNSMQQELAALSTHGRQIVIPDTSIILLRAWMFPPEISDAIRQIVEEAQSAKP